jgi:glutathione S-transferase
MVERSLYFTEGSPFARAIRIILDEIGLEWRREEALRADSAAERGRRTPALQVPVLREGALTLWDSGLIAEYLLSTYPERRTPDGLPPLAPQIARAEHYWNDKLLFATVQTLGESIVLVSQIRWSGIRPSQNAHVARNAERVVSLAGWLEDRLETTSEGFLPGYLSVQDIFCVCHLMFVTHRALEIGWNQARTPKLTALCTRLQQRPSFLAHPIEWWEPAESEPGA